MIKPDLSIDFVGIKLKNPILTASGTFGYGYEVADLIPLIKLGGIITKTITLDPHCGNQQPRTSEVLCGLLNSIGLQNIGIRAFVREPLKKLSKIGVPIIISISGSVVKEYVELAKILRDEQNIISAIELNLSCPNLKKMICKDLFLVQDVIESVKILSKVPVIAKLSPVTDIIELALFVQNAGADAITLANTYPAMAIDINSFKFKNPKILLGGVSGPCIKPMAIRCVYDTYKNIKIPIIGCGGIMNGKDVVEFMFAGATIVSVGTASLISPKNLIKILEEFESILTNKNIESVKEIVGICSTI
ncbi:MAG: dihydroorotate dehydrogenase [Endomicrobium sp.]|jgi:dihydroorotate dehydrogenase (NAD+) catalytic subunit|nr:dihydroorotate dehydrogenase [Endomicrobium sp.]